MKLVAGYAERAIVMRQGSVAFDGPTSRLFLDQDLLRETNLEYPPLFELSRALRQRGADVPSSLLRPEDFVEAVLSPSPLRGEGRRGGAAELSPSPLTGEGRGGGVPGG